MCRQESDGDGGAGEKMRGEEVRNGGGWITSIKTCRRETCQGRKHNTEFQ